MIHEVGSWSFRVDADPFETVIPVAPDGIPENLQSAIETLVTPLGTDRELVEAFLERWRSMARDKNESQYSLSTNSGHVVKVSAETVRLVDSWGKFGDCEISEAAFL